MERFLETVVIGAGCRLFRGDPLSVCVPLGFIWRKYSEFLNLRILIRGTSYRMPANAIREELAIA
jgi:vacuolar-type H+-ATPase subunit C/Vma6